MSRVEPNRNVYVGHRYVPKIFGEWDKQNEYEGLSIVTYQGASYTSKKRVPVGIDIKNEEFWVLTGNYNAQVEYYRDETERVSNELELKASQSELDNFKNITNENIENANNNILEVDERLSESLNESEDYFQQEINLLTDNVNNKIEQLLVNINDFNDIETAFNYASENDYRLYIPKKNIPYEINSNENIIIPQIISNGAEINVKGSIRFLFNDNILIKNLTINHYDDGGRNSDYSSSEYTGTLFQPINENLVIDWASIEEVNINGIVNNNYRVSGGITIPETLKWVKVKNLFSNNVSTTLWVKDSNNLDITNIKGVNCETLVWLQNFENANVRDLLIENTKTQSKWWVGKNNGVGSNGKDVLLCEGGNNIYMDNIKGIWAIERPIYCQSNNVTADNLESYNTGCFKFVGGIDQDDFKIKNVNIGTVTIHRTDPDVLDNIGQIYGCENIYYDKIIIHSGNFEVGPFRIYGNNDVVYINSIEKHGGLGTLFEKLSTATTNDLTINNVKYIPTGDYNGNGVLFNSSNGEIKYLTINNVDIDIKNGRYRENIYNDKPLSSNLKMNNIRVKNVSPSSVLNTTGLNNLLGTEINNYEIDVIASGSLLQGHNFNVMSDKPVNLKLNQYTETFNLNITFNKENNIRDNIGKYINKVNLYNKSNDTFILPLRNSDNSIIKIESLKGGYAEYILLNSVLTEKYNSGEEILIGDASEFQLGEKFTIRVNSDNLIDVRSRITGDNYKVSIEKIM